MPMNLPENALCNSFTEFAMTLRWVMYPETFGWDMLFVDEQDRRLGVQAKTGDAPLAVAQVIERMKQGNADVGAILIPLAGESVRRLCKALSVGVVTPIRTDGNGFTSFNVSLPTSELVKHSATRRRLPSVVPQVPAGVPSPKVLNEAEIQLQVLMEARGGWLKTKDFQKVGLRTQFLPRWLYRERSNHFVPQLNAVLPSEIHPQAYATIKARMEEKGLAKV